VNSQLSKEINFESVFRNLEHVIFCEILQKKFCLWSTLIGQSASVYKHRTKNRLRRLYVDVSFRKFISSVKSAHFRKKNFEIFLSKLISV